MKTLFRSVLSLSALLIGMIAACGFSQAASAPLEDKVVVYSTHGEAMLEMVADAFEKETGVRVDFINLKGELADRVRAEKGNPQSDVMYGAPSSVFMKLTEEGLFEPCSPAWAAQVSPLFKDRQGYWYGTIQTPVLMFYNSEMLTREQAPKDWSDLADPGYKDLLVFRNALSSSARATYSSLLQQYEMKNDLPGGWQFLKAVDANTKKYYGSGSLQFQAVGRKEAAISFAVLNSIIDNKMKNNMPLEVIDAASGSPVITDGIAFIKERNIPTRAGHFWNSPAARKSRPCSPRNSTACPPCLRPSLCLPNGWRKSSSRSWMWIGPNWLPSNPNGCSDGTWKSRTPAKTPSNERCAERHGNRRPEGC